MLHHVNGPVCPSCEDKLSHAHEKLVDWFKLHVKPTYPDMHVSWSFRDEASQEDAVLRGASKLHWPNSPHNKTPALALDLFQLDKGGARWDVGIFHTLSLTIPEGFKWGGDFNSLSDTDHFEVSFG